MKTNIIYKIGDKVEIRKFKNSGFYIGTIISINRKCHPYRTDDKLFTWYEIKAQRLIDGELLPFFTEFETCEIFKKLN